MRRLAAPSTPGATRGTARSDPYAGEFGPRERAIDRRLLRLSVTDRCDLRCRYCMPAKGVVLVAQHNLATLEELAAAVEWLADAFAIGRVKLTGGEPLVRRGVAGLVRRLAVIPGLTEISMTTNGTRLAKQATALRDAGLARVNVSLDTLDAGRFRALTGGGEVDRVVAGIDAALRAQLAPVKLNTVLRASEWRDDVPALLDFAAQRRLEIRFIELMRTGVEPGPTPLEFVAASTVRGWLASKAAMRVLPGPRDAPARRTLVRWRGRELAVGWITPVSDPFCAACSRLRLDARGNLRRCLVDPSALPLLPLLRSGREAELHDIVGSYLAGKRAPAARDVAQAMRAIGG
jgi:GTP 3',8-cyclase